MGPGLDAEGQGLTRLSKNGRVEAIRAADHQDQLAHAIVAQLADLGGKRPGRQGRAVFVAADQIGVADLGAQNLGLGSLAGLPGFNLDDVDRTEPERPPCRGGAGGVVLRQVGFGAAAQAADGEDRDLQFAPARCGLSTAQIFSML